MTDADITNNQNHNSKTKLSCTYIKNNKKQINSQDKNHNDNNNNS